MRTLQPACDKPPTGTLPGGRQGNLTELRAQHAGTRRVDALPMLSSLSNERHSPRWPGETEAFFEGLSRKARDDFESLATYFRCPTGTVLIREAQKPSSLLFLLEGEVTISMNSSEGRQFILEIARVGDRLGLHCAISGGPSEILAEARYPCRIASVQRAELLAFLLRYPAALQNVARELCVHHQRACERLRMLGLTSVAAARLAYLLLDWCRRGKKTTSGIRILCALTHEEIGEHIGASRETVSRTLADFKDHDLVRLRGTTLFVTNCRALAIYTGIDFFLSDSRRRIA